MNNGQNNGLFIFIVICVLAIILLVFIRRKLKRLVLPNVFLVDGAPKTGKSALSLYLIRVRYVKNVIMWHIGKPIWYLRYHDFASYPLKPMFYSNIPVGFSHNPLSKEIIYLEVQVPPKSCFFIDEASLFADSQLIQDKDLNMKLTIFCKTFGHVTRGGSMAINTQVVTDLHYSFKRILGRYLYIYQTTKLPLLSICQCREMVYSDDSTIVNDVNEDAELSMRKLVFFNFIYKMYDCFCYYNLVKNKPVQVDYNFKINRKDLSAYELISFNEKLTQYYADQVKGVKDENIKA